MRRYPFEAYPSYSQLSRFLEELRSEYPQLIELGSLGRSREGRELFYVQVTERTPNDPSPKPGVWVGGNIHGRELSGSLVALRFLHYLCSEYEQGNERIRTLLKKTVFYVAPRLNPDGAERALNHPPVYLRSGKDSLSEPAQARGYRIEDVDGDGRILWIRVPSPYGAWKAHPEEPRLLIRREPGDWEGPFYHLFPEGRWEGEPFLSHAILFPPRLDLNRNYPGARKRLQPEYGGLYPTSEPEVRAVVEFLSTHLNIFAGVDLHSYGGVILRPYSFLPDEEIPVQDLRVYQLAGTWGERLTRYLASSTYHGFRSSAEDTIYGAFDDWFYEYLGGLAFTLEIFSPHRLAEIEVKNLIQWLNDHPLEDDLRMLEMADRYFPGEAYVPWYPFAHPQFGPVEIGGWNTQVFFAPPPSVLEGESPGIFEWLLLLAQLSPELKIHGLERTPLGGGVERLGILVENTGWLPTYGMSKALERELPLAPTLTVHLLQGMVWEEQGHPLPLTLPHLEGIARFSQVVYEEMRQPFRHLQRINLVLSSKTYPIRGEVIVQAPRAGVARATL